MSLPAPSSPNPAPLTTLVGRLRDLALSGLTRMYRPDERLFAFRLRRVGRELALDGSSPRYTAIALIGLAGEEEAVQTSVLSGLNATDACDRLVREAARLDNLGDVALILWAACATGYRRRQPLVERLLAFRPDEAPHPTVEVAWTLSALCADVDTPPVLRRMGRASAALGHRLAHRLIGSFEPRSGMFPHGLGRRLGGLRGHVCCFADLVYPVHALARYAELFGDAGARDVALRCAAAICARQGPDGQWWWHYDRRTGDVVEGYPVYAVHQDAMAPMALFALQETTAKHFDGEIELGLRWLANAPELGGGSLIDSQAGLIWRKVARREPLKVSRYAQAIASRLHPAVRVPGLDAIVPVGAVDLEDRPYHLGWVLYAWPRARLT